MGYWKTHTGLGEPSRDPTYHDLPIFLGIDDDFNAPPEELIASEADADAVFAASGGLTISAMKAQLLAAKLNALKLPGFRDVQFADSVMLPSGGTVETFGDAIDAGDRILDAFATRNPVQGSETEIIKDLLDAANNGCATPSPTPTPTVAGAVAESTPAPSALPTTGGSPSASSSGLWAVAIALALLALGGIGLTAVRTREP
jgi:hypothetical protein